MKNRTMTSLSIGAVLSIAAVALMVELSPAGNTGSEKQLLERGKYLVNIMVCNDCHTPFKMGPKGPEPDMSRELSGHPQDLIMPAVPQIGNGPWVWAGAGTNTAFGGPWGTSFTANLTPDPETGLGKWTEETFIQAIRSGRHEGQGRPILPPMPWPQFRNASDEDLKAVFAYLRSIKPIKNRVPLPVEPVGAH